jgi:DNA-binding Lrp family transcriptional regulator
MVMLDKEDITILDVLEKDSRMPSREISEKTGLRPSTVHSRIQRMLKQGVIEKFTLKLNNDILGKNFVVYLLVEAKEDIPNKFFSDPRIEEVYGITGEYDLMIKCRFMNIAEFNTFLIRFRKNAQVGKTLTMVGTITIKEK